MTDGFADCSGDLADDPDTIDPDALTDPRFKVDLQVIIRIYRRMRNLSVDFIYRYGRWGEWESA